MEKHQSIRVRILVKAFPQPSQKHEETVCCAGITEDGRRLLRLYPIRYRRLPGEHQFTRFDLVEMRVSKALNDRRPESFRVDEASIRRIEPGDRLKDRSKVRLWQPFIAPSLDVLHEANRLSEQSLGIVRPDPGSVRFMVRPAKDADQADIQVAEQVRQVQNSLFEAPLQPLEPPEFVFSYRFTSEGKPHEHVIHDWEVQAAYRSYKQRYQESALGRLKQEYGEAIPAQNLHFIMGTMAAHPRTFIVIGLLRSPLDPAELGRQGSLL